MVSLTLKLICQEYATGHFVEPFAIIQDKFEEIKTRYVRATEEFLTKQVSEILFEVIVTG